MVRIIGDTTSALSESFANAHDITIIPQVIIFGEDSYLENVEIDYETFIARLRTSEELPKTAAPPPELFTEVFERHADADETFICVLPSAVVSGTVRSATVGLRMAEEKGLTDLDVRIIDTGLIASPVATLLKLAAQWVEAGVSADAIEQRVRDLSDRGKIYFSVDTLKYLAKGGRIGGAAALLGSVLKVKPILTFVDGQIEAFEKVRTHKRMVDRLKELVREQIAPERGHLSLMQADVPDEAQALADSLKAELGLDDVAIFRMPPAVVTHGGPGVLGVGFFMEEPEG
jgi:DegV family protein with EDD domain